MVRCSLALPLLLANTGRFLLCEARALAEANHLAGSYVVELEDSEDASGFYGRIGSKAETRMNFNSSLFRGVSIQFKNVDSAEEEAAALANLTSVKRVWRNRLYELPKDEIIWTGKDKDANLIHTNVKRQSDSDSFTPHIMTQVDKLRAKGITGKGIKIGIIDSGIDYTHPALGGCFGPGCLVSYGYDIVGDKYTGSNTPVPDNDPYDGCGGHGTHVGGIIAAQPNEYGFTGAAPGVTLGMYRVFGCQGSAANDVLIEAYLRAFEDGSNIITASIGGASGWSEDPWAVVVSRIVDAGVPCTVSAGNDGDRGLFYASTASDGKGVTSIASVDNWITPVFQSESSFSVDGGTAETFGYVVGDPAKWAGVKLPLWTPNFDTTDPEQACKPLPADTPDLSGKIVLIRRGKCKFIEKAANAAAKGAKYVLFYNNLPEGATAVSVAEVPAILGTGMTIASQGEAWVKALAAGSKILLDMADPKTAPISLIVSSNNRTGGAASAFTTWNPTYEMDVKPQVASPGGNILSTWPQTLGSYAVISGTSMACPLVAGIYALIAEVRGTFDPATLEALVASTANPRLFNNGTGDSDLLAPVPQVGAGLVQAYDAAYATTLLSESYLAFNDTDNLQRTLKFKIKNLGKRDVTYKLGSVGAATAYTFSTHSFPDVFPGLEVSDEYATVRVVPSTITLRPSGTAAVSVKVKPPKIDGSRLPVYSGYITINSTNGENLSLPYNGAVGSLYGTRILGNGYLASSIDPDLDPITGNASFVLSKNLTANTNVPVVVVLPTFGSPRINIKLMKMNGNKTQENLGDIVGSPYEYASRNPYVVPFDGRLANRTYVPAGTYQFSIEALHIFGDAADAEDYDIVTTVPFTIRYAGG
ncbi:peptidase S8/S53 domain-containing protein [Xylaria intraflava]|nr:peptidase S8/S53 domain-containing protein [Xylaria intraflava]